MKIYILAPAMIASAGLGAGAVQSLHAKSPPPAYVVTIFDRQIDMRQHDHPSLAPATFQAFGGRYIVHFGDVVAFEGTTPNDIVIIAFDSMDKARAWRASKVFKNLFHPARSISNVRTFAVAGVAQ
jgi:uncharacterized protein (DUF1330 family)